MKGKTCIVTGANSGIGFQTARGLALKGAKVFMICRNPAKGQKALETILAEVPAAELELVIADLSSQKQIRRAGASILDQTDQIDVLVNNAGAWFSKRTMTEDGIESVFAVNHLAYILLTHLIYPALQKAPEARIINVSSDNHFDTKIHFGNLYLDKKYNGLRSYAQSKLGNVLFTYELDRRKTDKHITVNALQPGLVKTDIGLKHTLWLHSFVWKLRRSGGVSPEEGAKTSLYLATSDEVKGVSAKYWDKCKPKPSAKLSHNTEAASKLWDISMELCGIDDFFKPI